MLLSLKNGQSVTIAATTSSAEQALAVNSESVVIANDGTTSAFIRIGLGSQTAVLTDFLLLGGQSIVISKPANHLNVAAITASGSTSIKVMPVDVIN